MRLPFIHTPPLDIVNSRPRAKGCLTSVLRRLQSCPQRLAEYTAFLDKYESLGHMRKLTRTSDKSEDRVYIPHHAVFREGSSTSPIRVVFNASSPTSNGSSLNDHLPTGPKLQQDLNSIILKWRQFKYVYTADIAKMYRQIKLDDRDQSYQCLLWKPNIDQAIIEYQLLTVTYGMKCAPSLALRVIQQLEHDEGSQFPLASSVFRDHMYVDDCIFGSHDRTKLRQTREQLSALLRRGGFELRKWASNSPELLMDNETLEHGLASKSLAADEQLHILGLAWNPTRDTFEITVAPDNHLPETKHSILSTIAKIYDPLGWITPVIITAKVLMQQLWRENLT